MSLLLIFLSCGEAIDSAAKQEETPSELVCIGYSFCCEGFCEPEGETTHYGEPDPCDCAEDYAPEARTCEAVDGTCQFVDE